MDIVLLRSCFVAARQIESLVVLCYTFRSYEPSSHFQVFVVVCLTFAFIYFACNRVVNPYGPVSVVFLGIVILLLLFNLT